MPTKYATPPVIKFTAKLYSLNSWIILRLPKDASAKLPSRGQVMVNGKFNSIDFQTPLEPDGNWGHWFKVEDKLLKAANVKADDSVGLEIIPVKNWPEPDVPADWRQALTAAPQEVQALWQNITPMARWEWIRWARATNNAETRNHRIEVGISKLTSGERRPCCWNRNLCSEPSVAKNGVLLDPEKATK